MSSQRLTNPNELLTNDNMWVRLLEIYFDDAKPLTLNLRTSQISESNPEANTLLRRLNLIEAGRKTPLLLTAQGRAAFLKASVDFSQLLAIGSNERFRYLRQIGQGKESVVYLAEHLLMRRQVAIKLFFSATAQQRYTELFDKLATVSSPVAETLILPSDIFAQEVVDVFGQMLKLESVVFPVHNGETLDSFLRSERPLTPYLVREFLIQIGGVLAHLHKLNIPHGDLHLENVVIEQTTAGIYRFRLIDFTGAAGDCEVAILEEWSHFTNMLAFLLSRVPLERMSIQRHLGAKTYVIVSAILSGSIGNAHALQRALTTNELHTQYIKSRERFIIRKFKTGDSLGLFRHEEISSPEAARDLFLPYEPFFQEFSAFGSAVLHGHRGSGKSSYLAALAYLPSARRQFCDPRRKFGILFTCRQGEFKQFNALSQKAAKKAFASLKHLLITKIVRKTLNVLASAVKHAAAETVFDISPLEHVMTTLFPLPVALNFEMPIIDQVESLYEATLRYEMQLADSLIDNAFVPPAQLIGEQELISFFRHLRRVSSQFISAQFFVLFDDAGVPNMPNRLQRVLNELLRAANDVFCIKVSAERFSFCEEDSDGKVLEVGHDFTPFNLAESLILRGGQEIERAELKTYFERLLALRLSNYASRDIEKYLGAGQQQMQLFVAKLARDDKSKSLYSGWNIVWQVADRTPRHLLELVSTIFKKANVTPTFDNFPIDPAIQDEAVRGYSEMRLRHISYIPGKIELGPVTKPLGQHLSNVTLAFGKICRRNLERGVMKGNRGRYYEMLAIEVDKEHNLTKWSYAVLRMLIRYAIFDDTITATTFDGGLRKPIYVLNRIYCPALRISIRRVTHWRVNSSRFDSFLVDPWSEARKVGANPSSELQDLFGGSQ